jgi:hypothetical protein
MNLAGYLGDSRYPIQNRSWFHILASYSWEELLQVKSLWMSLLSVDLAIISIIYLLMKEVMMIESIDMMGSFGDP